MRTIERRDPSHKPFGQTPTSRLALALFTLAPLAACAFLLTLRHFTLRDLLAAANWHETPCVMERSEFVHDSDSGRSLQIVYRYEIDGREYRGDRLYALIGRMGDDDLFEESVHAAYPIGASAVCYVDPQDPSRSIFDRDYGHDAPRRLWLLAFPFLFIGATFGLGLASTFLPLPAERDPIGAEQLPAAPRKISWLTRLSVMAGPSGSQLAWPFLVGFAYVFVVMDGPAVYGRLLNFSDRNMTTGRVTHVRALDAREMRITVYQYMVDYEVNGIAFSNASYGRGRKHEVGDAVSLTYRPKAPEKATILGARESQFLWWYCAIPLGVVLLLALGLCGMLYQSFRASRLVVVGRPATARWHAGLGDKTECPGYPPSPTLISDYEFEVDGRSYRARRYAPSKKYSAEATVLYRQGRPGDNVLFDDDLATLIDPRQPVSFHLMHVAAGPLCVLALWLLLGTG